MEYIFNTISAENNFKVANPTCMKTIVFKRKSKTSFDDHDIIHPIKNEDEKLIVLQNQKHSDSPILFSQTSHKKTLVDHKNIFKEIMLNLVFQNK